MPAQSSPVKGKLPRPVPPVLVVLRILLLPAPMSSSVDAECVCIICYASVPPPIQSGCACRSDSGLAQGKYADAERIEREVLGALRRVQGEEHPDTLSSAHNLASMLSQQGKHADAERIHREVLDVTRRVVGEEHPATLSSANNLAVSLSQQGKYADAERIGREVLGVRRQVLGEEHPDTLTNAGNLAQSLSEAREAC